MQQALKDNGLGDERGTSQYVRHGQKPEQTLTGRVLGKGLAGDGLSETTYLVLDGIDARVHHVEFPNATKLDGLQRGMIVEVTPPITQPRTVDLNIQQNADADGVYSPSTHLAHIRDRFTDQGKDPEVYIRRHVRRLEALRRAGHVERVHAEHWTIPKDYVTEIVSRCSLILAMYGRPHSADCGVSEHTEIVDALVAGDAAKAAGLMDHHVAAVASRALLEAKAEPDLRDVLAPYAARMKGALA